MGSRIGTAESRAARRKKGKILGSIPSVGMFPCPHGTVVAHSFSIIFAHFHHLRIERSPKMASEPKSDTHRARTLGWPDMPSIPCPPFAPLTTPSTVGRRRFGSINRSIDRSIDGTETTTANGGWCGQWCEGWARDGWHVWPSEGSRSVGVGFRF